MNIFFKKVKIGSQRGFASLILLLAVAVASAVIGYTAFENQKKVEVVTPVKTESKVVGANGTEIPTSVALFETSLSSAITTSATSMTLVSATNKAGTTFASSTYAFILDEGTASEEMVLADCTSTACTNMIRGLSPLTGTTTVSTLKFAHRRGASVKITDGPQLLILSRMANGQNDYPNLIRYKSGTSVLVSDSGQTLVTKAYAEALANSGAATSTESRGGIVELGTLAEQASSYDGGSDKPTILQTKNSTSTCQVVGSYNIVASSTTGRLDKGCFDQTAAYTLTATTTMSGISISTGHGIAFSDGTTQTTAGVGAKFGGDGSDGALSITSGATNIDLGSAAIVTKNYTSISITGTGSLTFTNPHAGGTLIKLLSQGAVTLTSSASPMINASGKGALTTTTPNITIDGASYVATVGGTGGNGGGSYSAGAAGSAGGAGSAFNYPGFYTTTSNKLETRSLYFAIGTGGATGGNGGTSNLGAGGTGGTGGRGGATLYIESGGAFNFTTASGISVAGATGGTGNNGLSGAGAGSGGGGGGGGGNGGLAIILYNSLTANSGTITVSGGATGTGGSGGNAGVNDGTNNGGGGGGGGGGSGGGVPSAGAAGSAGTIGQTGSGSNSGAGGAGGAGAAGLTGYSVVAKNIWFN